MKWISFLLAVIVSNSHLARAQTCKSKSGRPGVCLDRDTTPCGSVGAFEAGACPGPSHVQCCVFRDNKTSGGTDACYSNSGKVGICLNRDKVPCSGVEGVFGSGECPGPSEVQCCVYDEGPVDKAIQTYFPPPPDVSSSSGSCTATYSNRAGECISLSKCTGAVLRGKCGSTSNFCCFTETIAAVYRPSKYYDLSASQFSQFFGGVQGARRETLRPYFNAALSQLLDSATSKKAACYRLAAFIAQIGHESLGLFYFEELADGSDYEGRDDLGNTQPGDGRRYKGRGPIQLTGRDNYKFFSRDRGINIESDPERPLYASMGFQTTVWYWQVNNLNRYATSSTNDFLVLTELINGGDNGLEDRLQRWAAAKSALSCSTASTVIVTREPVTDGPTSTGTDDPDSTTDPVTDEPAGGGSIDDQLIGIAVGAGTGTVCLLAYSVFAVKQKAKRDSARFGRSKGSFSGVPPTHAYNGNQEQPPGPRWKMRPVSYFRSARN